MQTLTLHAIKSVEAQRLLKLTDRTYTRDLEIRSERGDFSVQLFADKLEGLFFEQIPKVHLYNSNLFLVYKLNKELYAVFSPSEYRTLAKAVEDPCNLYEAEAMEEVWGYKEDD